MVDRLQDEVTIDILYRGEPYPLTQVAAEAMARARCVRGARAHSVFSFALDAAMSQQRQSHFARDRTESNLQAPCTLKSEMEARA